MSNHNSLASQKKEQNASSKNWHRAEIIAEVKKKGSSLASLSRVNGLHKRTLYNVLDRSWPKGEKIIADFLGLKVSDIWPERYRKNI
ncbi:helix-turn-helix domain-containing protein [Providencia sp. PROV120]|uniref:helix-turn-helix domain-containing protein n=1 Tax=Providencia sp. PROV120 TaxID=2949831 RepID=UPI00234BC9C0|nr:helix-turn-helix transcriptional regulator [Providencia sp. PROV120]